VGQTAKVTTKVFDSSTSLTVAGKIVAVRGHDSEDEEWDVVIRCGNRINGDPNGVPILPINYNFDYDDTSIDLS
jgi:hypothetical protein